MFDYSLSDLISQADAIGRKYQSAKECQAFEKAMKAIQEDRPMAECFCLYQQGGFDTDDIIDIFSVIDSDNFLSPTWIKFTDGSEVRLVGEEWQVVNQISDDSHH